MEISDLSEAQIDRLARRLYARILEGQGYQPFGYDWSTLYAVRPALARAYADVLKDIRRRKEVERSNSIFRGGP